jgi:hypothetical protein
VCALDFFTPSLLIARLFRLRSSTCRHSSHIITLEQRARVSLFCLLPRGLTPIHVSQNSCTPIPPTSAPSCRRTATASTDVRYAPSWLTPRGHASNAPFLQVTGTRRCVIIKTRASSVDQLCGRRVHDVLINRRNAVLVLPRASPPLLRTSPSNLTRAPAQQTPSIPSATSISPLAVTYPHPFSQRTSLISTCVSSSPARTVSSPRRAPAILRRDGQRLRQRVLELYLCQDGRDCDCGRVVVDLQYNGRRVSVCTGCFWVYRTL